MSHPDAVEMDVIIKFLIREGEMGQIEKKGKSVDDVYHELTKMNFTLENIDLFWKNCHLKKSSEFSDSYPLSLFSEDGKNVELFLCETERHLALDKVREFRALTNQRTVIYGKEKRFVAFDIKEGINPEATEKHEIKQNKKYKFFHPYQTFGLVTRITEAPTSTHPAGKEYEFLEFKTDKQGTIEIIGAEENEGLFDKDKDKVLLLTGRADVVLLESGVKRKFHDANRLTPYQIEKLRLERAAVGAQIGFGFGKFALDIATFFLGGFIVPETGVPNQAPEAVETVEDGSMDFH